MEKEDSSLLELGKVKPIEEEESNKMVKEPSKRQNIEEDQKVNPPPNWRRRHPCLACCGVCSLVLLLIAVLIIILVFTLFKVKDPRLHVDSIALDHLNVSLPFNFPLSFSLNITLDLELSLKNPNRASVNYHNSTAHMSYRGIEVGFAPVPPGHVGARDTEQISLTIDLMADRLIGSPYIIGDFTNGSLPFSTTTHISGRAKILQIFKHHFESLSVCNITIFIANQSISNTFCTYDTHL